MKKQFSKTNFKLWLAGLLCLMFLIPASSLSAWRGGEHYRYGGGWYGRGWYGWYGPRAGWYVGMPIGTFVEVLPYGYSTVIIDGYPYYYYGNIYYRAIPDGYVVVPAPVAGSDQQAASATSPTASQTTDKSGKKITINIPDSHGGFTPVTLKKFKTGYIGPQGEFYEGKPSVEQLKVLYGE